MKLITHLRRILAVIMMVALPALGSVGCAVHLQSLPGHQDDDDHDHEHHDHGHGKHRKHHKHHKGHKHHHGEIVVIITGHVHTDSCGHFCCGEDWFLLEGHVHGQRCGHELAAGLWIVP